MPRSLGSFFASLVNHYLVRSYRRITVLSVDERYSDYSANGHSPFMLGG